MWKLGQDGIDTFFFNTRDVDRLSNFYSALLGRRVVRRTVLAPPSVSSEFTVWSEIALDNLQLSFRLAGGTVRAHPEFQDFVESSIGAGGTVTFEVVDTEAVREHIRLLGFSLLGSSFPCSYGKEIVSVFADPWGRLFQLYECRFDGADFAEYYPVDNWSVQRYPDAADSAVFMDIGYFMSDPKETEEFYARAFPNCIRSADNRVRTELKNASISFHPVDAVGVHICTQHAFPVFQLDTRRKCPDISDRIPSCRRDPDGNSFVILSSEASEDSL